MAANPFVNPNQHPIAAPLLGNGAESTTAIELADIYVYRTLSGRYQVVHITRCEADPHLNYNYLNPVYRVRIPLFMVITVARAVPVTQINDHVRGFFAHRYRRQLGGHCFIHARFNTVESVGTYWQGDPRPKLPGGNLPDQSGPFNYHYTCSTIRSIESVYPCMRYEPDIDRQKVVLGLGWCDIQREMELINGNQGFQPRLEAEPREHIRTHGMYMGWHHHQRVYDLTDCFIEERPFSNYPDVVNWDDYCNPAMFPPDREVTAFYVCKGARLLVLDDDWNIPEGMTGPPHKHVRSLVQQGGLMVVTGYFRFQIDVWSTYQGKRQARRFEYQNFLQNRTDPCRANETMDQYEAQYDPEEAANTVSGLRRRVIFLGATESQCNSVTWQIYVDQFVLKIGASFIGTHQVDLICPEGGRFDDITSWNAGFRLIRARHQYERLYESGLEMSNPAMPLPTTTDTPFVLPTEYEFQRIVGLQHRRHMTFDIPYERLDIPRHFVTEGHNNDRDIRRYIGFAGLRLIGGMPENVAELFHNQLYMDWPQWQGFIREALPLPSVYPPVIWKDTTANKWMFRYLLEKEKVNLAPGNYDPTLALNQLQFKVHSTRPIVGTYSVRLVYMSGRAWAKSEPGKQLEATKYTDAPQPYRTRFAIDGREHWAYGVSTETPILQTAFDNAVKASTVGALILVKQDSLAHWAQEAAGLDMHALT